MSAFVPATRPNFPQYAPIVVGSAGDGAIIRATPPYRIVVTSFGFDGNGLDQVVQFKSGGATGGQSNAVLGQFTVGPNASVPGVYPPPNPAGHTATLAPTKAGGTPDDFVINVAGTNGNVAIGLTGLITFELREPI